LPTDLDVDVWFEICSRLTQLTTSSRFWLGDALNHGEKIYGDEYFQVFDHIEAEVGRLRDYAYVARQIPPSMREEGVYWTHYRELASVKDTELQLDLLAKAKSGELDSRGIAREKNKLRKESGEEVELEEFEETLEMVNCPCCYGNGKLQPHKAEQVKRVLAELDYHDGLT